MTHVLVTGCNGFIGSKLTENLVKKGYKVLGVTSSKKPLLIHENFEYIQLNLNSAMDVEKLFKNYDISLVIHLAAIAHLKGKEEISWNEFYRTNVLASKTIFQCSIKVGADIFYASTVDVYGKVDLPLIKEKHTPKPISDYAKTKLIAENILRELAAVENINYCIGRFAPVYSKNFMKDVYKRIYIKYPFLAFQIENGIDYHFVSINNVIDFIILWVEKRKKLSGTFNICDDKYINSKEFIKLEKKNGNAKKVMKFSRKTLSTIDGLLKLTRFTSVPKVNKISTNMYKLINPPKYSNEKLKEFMDLRWNLINTVYEDVE